ncbi:LptA, protein essential for LPS transport across the periplasm [Klebsiella pneumoniae]|uniref:LptA, protein essential for LPS transport across the periplasm n=1 Tax=Klebsiella pneumoniae TaxID=573 RepID=A0A447RSE4_KLEPN|nr:LptA, protein essential for LPS transport across the periplasm [Klebsiella pneumoniae]
MSSPFTGNVVVTQGTIKINADKVVVTRPGNEKGKEVIEGFGNPATFYQMQDNGKPGKKAGRRKCATSCRTITSC